MEISGKGLITSLYFKAKVGQHKFKKARYAIRNVSKKDLSKIIWEFHKLPYEIYDKKRPKHAPTESYIYLARQLTKFMMRADDLNSHSYPVRTEMTDTSSHACSTNKDKSNGIILHETLSQSFSTDEYKSKSFIANETLLQSSSTNKD